LPDEPVCIQMYLFIVIRKIPLFVCKTRGESRTLSPKINVELFNIT